MSRDEPSRSDKDDQPGQVDFDLTDWAVESRVMLQQLLVADSIPYVWEAAVLVVPARSASLVDGMIDYVEAVGSDPVGDGGFDDDTFGDRGSDDGSDDGGYPASEPVDGFDDDDLDGVAVQDLLSELFVGVDRLRHDARDPEGVLGFVDAVEQLESLALPFGFEPEVWRDLVSKLVALRDSISQDSADDTAIERSAGELRDVLHPLV